MAVYLNTSKPMYFYPLVRFIDCSIYCLSAVVSPSVLGHPAEALQRDGCPGGPHAGPRPRECHPVLQRTELQRAAAGHAPSLPHGPLHPGLLGVLSGERYAVHVPLGNALLAGLRLRWRWQVGCFCYSPQAPVCVTGIYKALVTHIGQRGKGLIYGVSYYHSLKPDTTFLLLFVCYYLTTSVFLQFRWV